MSASSLMTVGEAWLWCALFSAVAMLIGVLLGAWWFSRLMRSTLTHLSQIECVEEETE